MSSAEYRPLGQSSSDFMSGSSHSSTSKYSKVIFTEIPDFYDIRPNVESRDESAAESHVTIVCRVYQSIEVTAEDAVVVKKVDQTSPLVTYHVTQCLESDQKSDYGERVLRIRLSRDLVDTIAEDEFYQFQYLRRNADIEEVFGASVPFRFRKTDSFGRRPEATDESEEEEDFLVVRSPEATDESEEEEDFLVVRSPEAVLQQRIENLLTQKGSLETGNRFLEKRVTEAEVELIGKQRQLDQLEEIVSRRTDEKTCLEEEVRKLKERTESLEMILAEVKRERDSMGEELERRGREWGEKEQLLDRKICEHKSNTEEVSAKMSLIEAKEEFLRTSLAKELSAKRDLEDEVKKLRQTLEEVSEKNAILVREVLEVDKTRLKAKVMVKSLEEEMDQLRQELKRTAEEHELKMDEMRGRLTSAADEYRKVFRSNEKLTESKDRLKQKIKTYIEAKQRQRLEPSLSDHFLSADSDKEEDNRGPEAEERFQSTDSRLPCVVCAQEFPSRPALVAHLESSHAQRLCPICSLPFDSRLTGHEEYFRMHVENHLECDGYPKK